MELTHTYNHKASVNGLRTSYQQTLLAFINRHADVFEALARQGAPFGGNWWPLRQRPVASATANTMREQIARAQQQVNELTQTVSLLSDQIRSMQSSERESVNVKASAEVGINRFRALQAR